MSAYSQKRTLAELVEKRLCILEVRSIEAFGEPIIDRRKQVARFGRFALVLPQASEAHRSAKFQRTCVLALRDLDGMAEGSLGFGHVVGRDGQQAHTAESQEF